MAHRRYLVLLWAKTFITCPSTYHGTEKQARGTGQCLYEKNTEHGLGRKHWYSELGRMAYGISRAMIPPLHTLCWLRLLFLFSEFFFFHNHKAVLGCPNLQRGID